MRKFILKIILVLSPVIIFNILFGILRYNQRDKTIPYLQNFNKQYITLAQIDHNVGFVESDSQQFDMSREFRYSKMMRYRDCFGFQNFNDIKNPKVLFIGDSFLDDPFLSYDKGLSFNFEQSLNIASNSCSGFKVFNELKELGYFSEFPNFIFIEVVERNLLEWGTLWKQIEKKETKTTPYNYFGLDLLFGNNFYGASMNNLGLIGSGSVQKLGVSRKVDGRDVYFLNNAIQPYKSEMVDKIVANMISVSKYFNNNNCQVIFVVAPDKESVFPEIFSSSNLPIIQRQMEAAQLEYIDMYGAIMQSPRRKNCYFDGDTHWNEEAYEILINEIRNKLDSLDFAFRGSY